MLYRIGLITYLLSLSFLGLSQEKKVEVEVEVKKSEVPEAILISIEPLAAESKKIKFYKESDSVNIFYEVKLKYLNKKFSVKYNEIHLHK